MSALTSLLVRDDAVSVRQIEEALARQVVDGGELDTALLELAALPENKLIAYRAASERGKPATREEVMSASSAARALVPGELAVALQIMPLAHQGETLTVAAIRALRPVEIRQLSERTGMQIDVRITAELRVLAALERFYGHALLPRHAVLLNRVDAQAPGALITVEPLQQAVTRSIRTEQLPAFEEAEDFQAVLAAAFERASMSPHAGTPAVDPDETRPLSTRRAFDLQRKRSRASDETAKLGSSGLIQARPAYSSVRSSLAPQRPDSSAQNAASAQPDTRELHPESSASNRGAQPDTRELHPESSASNREAQPDTRELHPESSAQHASVRGAQHDVRPDNAASRRVDQRDARDPRGEGASSRGDHRDARDPHVDIAAQRAGRDLRADSPVKPASARGAVLQPSAAKLTMADVQGVLASVEDRDLVMDVYFRFARQMFDATVLFTLKDGRAIGAKSHNVKSLSDIRDVSLPVVRGSALEELTRTLLPRVMDLGRKDDDRPLVSAIQRLDAQPSALVPVCIKRRVVAVLYGDRTGKPLQLEELTDLLTLMPHVTSAFERIIRARKALGLSSPPSNIGELSHAPTQRSLPAQPVFTSEARTAELNQHATQAIEALKIPRAVPPSRAFGLHDDDGDIYATARIPIQPLPLDQFESPPRYFSKPPPGTGRYQSLAPKNEEILRPPSTPSEERTSSSRRPAPRSDAAGPDSRREGQARQSYLPGARRASNAPPPPARRSSAVPPAAPASRRSLAPPPTRNGDPAASHPSSAAPKPGPGSGVYHSHIGTTELISVPRNEEAAALAELPSPEPPSAAPGFFLRSDSRPPAQPRHEPANQNESQAGYGFARHASLPPPKAASRSAAPAPPPEAPRANPITLLIDELCRSEPGEDPPSVKALVALGEPALMQLFARFPGPLWFDRRRPHARVPLGRDISPVCRALDAFGDQAVERLGPALGSNMTEVRYYATLFACDRIRPSLLAPLLTRLFDDDPQIRLLVRDVLPHYRKFDGFERVTERLCEKARAENAALYERLTAIDAISVLRDPGSVSTLIELIAHRDKQICVPAHRALTLITCQDFGKTPKKWRSWLNANADQHRVEWLIDGLMHSDEAMRATAGLELQKLTQVYYGYVAAASKREREAAQKRYAEWWRTEGRTRLSS